MTSGFDVGRSYIWSETILDRLELPFARSAEIVTFACSVTVLLESHSIGGEKNLIEKKLYFVGNDAKINNCGQN